MRIAFDARLVSYLPGGTSQYSLRLVHALATLQTGDEILVLEGRWAKASTGLWPPDLKRRRLLTPPHHRWEQITLPVELLPIGAALLHSPDFIPPFRRRCRSVITVHDLAFLRYPHLLTPASARYYGRVGRAVESADQIIAVSEATRQDLLTLLQANPAKVTVVHEAAGSDCRPLDNTERRRWRDQLDLPERFLLFVGTLEPRKNLPTLLKAFAQVWKEHRVPLVVVGRQGWLYQEVFETRDRLGLGEEVRFVGAVPAERLVYYYNCATCLVLPSLYEGFGLPVLEAMACGTPVVVSNVSSLPEIAGDAGLKVAPEDVEGLAGALAALLSDESLHRTQSLLGLRRARDFSWERAARETLAVYHRAVENR